MVHLPAFHILCLPPLAFFIYFRSGMRPLGGSHTSALLFLCLSSRPFEDTQLPRMTLCRPARDRSLSGCVDLRRTSRLWPCVLIISHLVSSSLHSAQLPLLPPSVALSETITRLFISLGSFPPPHVHLDPTRLTSVLLRLLPLFLLFLLPLFLRGRTQAGAICAPSWTAPCRT